MPRPIFLTGMMGAGKSTIGRLLARTTGAPFVDLDQRIEHMFGQSIEALFAMGEASFRRHERLALESLLAEPGFAGRATIVAAGGGIVLDPDNLDTMHRVGVTVFVDVPVAELAARLQSRPEGDAGRPLLAGAGPRTTQVLQEILSQREPAYARCRVRIDGTGTPELVAQRIRAALAALEPDRGGNP